MSFFYVLGKNPVRLFILSQTLLLIAFVWRDFPLFIFLAIAPLFALVDHPSALKDSYLPFLAAIVTALIFSLTMQESMKQSSIFSWIIYFTLLAAVFAAYIFAQRMTHNRLNKFALIIFILGAEYLFLKLMTNFNPVFLADLLRYKPTWTRWNIFTGYGGATLWILLINLLIYEAIFREESINWLVGILAVVLTVVPLVISLNANNDALTKADVIGLYSANISPNALYSERGELISRTGAWVSALIIIFTLIKAMTKKVSR